MTINDFLGALNYIFKLVIKYMFINGVVENWIIIIDFQGIRLLDIPFAVI
jgi:hypothetical protein